MDDLEFRRRLLSDPKARDSEIQDALASSEKNNKFAEDLLDLDSKIAAAMNVPVPDDLADKILYQQTANHAPKKPQVQMSRQWLAMAASVTFVFGLLLGQLNWGNLIVPTAQASMADTAVELVRMEQPFVARIDEQVDTQQINAKMKPFSKIMVKDFPYHVYYLNHCGFGETNAVHIVFSGKSGKVTLFLTNIPTTETSKFKDGHLHGTITPVGESSLILVGEMDEDMESITKAVIEVIETDA